MGSWHFAWSSAGQLSYPMLVQPSVWRNGSHHHHHQHHHHQHHWQLCFACFTRWHQCQVDALSNISDDVVSVPLESNLVQACSEGWNSNHKWQHCRPSPARWWFQVFFFVTLIWQNDPFWLTCLFNGLKPPTSLFLICLYHSCLYRELIWKWTLLFLKRFEDAWSISYNCQYLL